MTSLSHTQSAIPKPKPAVCRLGLGTVQFGMAYGASNKSGQVSVGEADAIVALAADAGISVLDTASQYGAAESILGRVLRDRKFKIVTKTPVLQDYAPDIAAVRRRIKAGFDASCEKLGKSALYALLVHHAADLRGPLGPAIRDMLLELRQGQKVQKIGVSVYDARDLDNVLTLFAPDIVQLPLSVFDQRLLQSGHIDELARIGVEVHARSVLLQGVLLIPDSIPDRLHALRQPVRSLHADLRESGLSPTAAVLGFALARRDVASVIVGAQSVDELNELITAAALSENDIPDLSAYALDDPCLVEPRCWPRA